MPVTGLDLPVKLRRALGAGEIVPAEELADRMAPFAAGDSDALDREQLAKFLLHHRVGGPWFCQMMAHNLFRTAEDRWTIEVAEIKIEALARIVHYTMARANKAVKRYVLTPEAVMGLEPKRALDGGDPTVPTESLMRGGRPLPRKAPPRKPPRGRGPRRVAGRAPPRGRSAPRRSGGRPGPRGPRRPGKPRG